MRVEDTDKEDMAFIQLAQSPDPVMAAEYDETLKPKSAEEEGREQAQMAHLEEETDEDEGPSGEVMDETDHKKNSEQEGREQAAMARLEEDTDKEDMAFIQLAQSPDPVMAAEYDETLKPKSADQEGRVQAQMARLEQET